MPRPGQITSTPVHVPGVLIVQDAAWPELFARCLVAATRAGVLVHRCELLAAATFAAERRPIAIVLSNAVHAIDPEEFDALARDVQATLLKVDEEVSERELEAMFVGALRERERRDEGGRYAVIRPTGVETPLGRSSQLPPPSSRMPPLSRGSHLPPPSSRAAPPPSSRAAPPARSFTPLPPSRPAPPSVRTVPPGLPPRPARSMTPAPATPRSAELPPTPAMPPVKAQGDSPRSGVRQYGGDPLDAVFDEQPLPIEGSAYAESPWKGPANAGRRGSAT